ncbi:DNA-directed RNA polymerase subunit L [Candidatus Woesearchaeota archaeon]|nr:DNA-directed RNA polymerase subunit L [Candidatus Woesearchaeota archaeon]
MEINILEDSKNKLVVEIKGEGHALCSALEEQLWKNKKVKSAGYNVAHPLINIPKVTVEADAPKDALIDAAKAVKKDAEAFLKAFTKAAK